VKVRFEVSITALSANAVPVSRWQAGGITLDLGWEKEREGGKGKGRKMARREYSGSGSSLPSLAL